MKTTKLITGILSVVLSLFVLLQSCAAGLANTLEENGEIGGSAGAVVAICLMAAGIVAIVTRKGGKGGSIACAILYGFAALCGIAMAGSYSDLKIWGGLCAILAIMHIVSAIKSAPVAVDPVINSEDNAHAEGNSSEQKRRIPSWIFSVILILIGVFSAPASILSGALFILAGAILNPVVRKRFEVKSPIAIVLAIVLAFAGFCVPTGGNNESNAAGAGSGTEAADKTSDNSSADSTDSTSEGDLGDYHVKILDSSIIKDWEGNDTIRIEYEFTNNDEEATSALIGIVTTAFQDGVELESTFGDDEDAEYDNWSKEIKSGVTVTCAEYFTLTSESDVEFEVEETFSLSDTKLEKTFSVK